MAPGQAAYEEFRRQVGSLRGWLASWEALPARDKAKWAAVEAVSSGAYFEQLSQLRAEYAELQSRHDDALRMLGQELRP